MSDSDDTLLARLKQGEPDALAEFLGVKRGALLAFVERRLGPGLRRKLEPDDIVQEASAEAARVFPEIDLTDREPFAWLCLIAERRIVDAHRHFFAAQKRAASRETPLGAAGGGTRPAIIDMLVASMTTASQALARNERERRLHEALAQLPESMGEALRLRYVEGLPSKEIAARLGKTDGATRVMLTRGLNRLLVILGPESGLEV